jgi:hypothetical protein
MDIGWEAGILGLARAQDEHTDCSWQMFSALPCAPVVAERRRRRSRRRLAGRKTRRG